MSTFSPTNHSSPAGKHVPADCVWQSSLKNNLTRILKRRGLPGLQTYLGNRYERWIALFDEPSASEIQDIANQQARLTRSPDILVLIDTANSKEPRLQQLSLESLQRQFYSNWRSATADELDTAPIAAQYVLRLRAGDTLASDALYLAVLELEKNPDIDVISADHDTIDRSGKRSHPKFLAQMNRKYSNSRQPSPAFILIRTKILQDAPQPVNDLSFDRISSSILPARKSHLPFVLYHRLSSNGAAKTDAKITDAPAIEHSLDGAIRLSIVFVCPPDIDPGPAVQSLLSIKDSPELEVIVVTNQPQTAFGSTWQNSESRITIKTLDPNDARILNNQARANNFATSHCTGDIIAFLNTAVLLDGLEWLKDLAMSLSDPNIAVIAPAIYNTNGTIYSAGLTLQDVLGPLIRRCYAHYAADFPGYNQELLGSREVCAVDDPVFLIRKQTLEDLGGFDENYYGFGEFVVVDLCLRARKAGLQIVQDGHAGLRYFGQLASYNSDSINYLKNWTFARFRMLEKFGTTIVRDPFFNSNLPLRQGDSFPRTPPGILKPYLDLTQRKTSPVKSIPARGKDFEYQLGIVTMFQNEARFLREWLEFHHMLGVQKFILYNNRSQDNYLEVLRPYISCNLVTLVDWQHEAAPKQYPVTAQLKAFEQGANLLAESCKWVAFIDTDEFLFPVQGQSIPDILSRFGTAPAVCVNWRIFGTAGIHKLAEHELLIERLDMALPLEHPENFHVKSIARPSLIEQCPSPHFFQFHGADRQVNTDGLPFSGPFSPYIANDALVINHYRYRDVYHFQTEKLARREDAGVDSMLQFQDDANYVQDRTIQRFADQLKARINK